MLNIPINDQSDGTRRVPAVTLDLKCLNRAKNDLLYIYNSDMYINEKGYLQKLVDLLFDFGYYIDNESLFS